MRVLAAGPAQCQSYGGGINATACLCAGILTFGFLRHPGPQA